MADYERFEQLFCGTWVFERDENLSAFLDVLEATEEERKLADMKASVTYSRAGSSITMAIDRQPTKFEITFAFGEECEIRQDSDNPQWRIKSTSKMEGDSLHDVILNMKSGKQYTSVATVSGDELIKTATCGGVTWRRIYRRG